MPTRSDHLMSVDGIPRIVLAQQQYLRIRDISGTRVRRSISLPRHRLAQIPTLQCSVTSASGRFVGCN
jgi:hypothetical protein